MRLHFITCCVSIYLDAADNVAKYFFFLYKRRYCNLEKHVNEHKRDLVVSSAIRKNLLGTLLLIF